MQPEEREAIKTSLIILNNAIYGLFCLPDRNPGIPFGSPSDRDSMAEAIRKSTAESISRVWDLVK